ncbi:hypothetical protein [Priestia aryabhattai]|uniref:hypothetical protein n=1 Tax=Priestia aryabhattai TaxID=412384 RepID=UPI0015C682EB|nr:hypothetical protein [Priestia aryabhattai]
MQTQTTVNKDVKVAALKELEKFIQSNNIDLNTYICPDGNIDIKTLLQDHGMKL